MIANDSDIHSVAMMSAVLFRESIQVGTTQMSPQRVQQVVQEMGETYKGNAYHLLQRNCNHFSNDLCQKLTGQQAPLWVGLMQLLYIGEPAWHSDVHYVCHQNSSRPLCSCQQSEVYGLSTCMAAHCN